jgi:hypothetical protein
MGERINAAWELAVRKGPLCPRFVPMRWNDLWGNGAGERLESLAFSSPCRWRGSSFGVVQFGIDVLTIIHRQVALFDLALCAGRRDVGGATTDRLQSRLSVRIPPAPPTSPSPFANLSRTPEKRAIASCFAQLVAAENAFACGFRRFAARLIRSNKIRGHEKHACLPVLSAGTDGKSARRAPNLQD